jgi:spartin
MSPESGAFTRIEFPGVGYGKGSQEDVDTFETILAQCTAFLERAQPPRGARYAKGKSEKGALPPYNPSEYKPGEAYAAGSTSSHAGGQIVLVDEENGSVVGELGEGFHVVEDSKMQAGSKGKHSSSELSGISLILGADPVEITLPQDGSQDIGVAPASSQYLEMSMHPAYKNSLLVSKAAMASRLIVTTSSYVSKTLQGQADNFKQKTKPATKPMTFKPTTYARIRKINTFSEGAAGLSAKTVGQVSKYAQNLGATLAKRGQSQKGNKGIGPDGKSIDDYKPGLLNKSMMAFSTIADGIDQAGRNLLASTSTAATTVVGHKFGPEAREISEGISSGFKNVGLVYIDAAGVSRRAIVKSVAKGMVVGKVRGGGDLVVGGGDGGIVTGVPQNWKEQEAAQCRYTDDVSIASGRDGPDVTGFGRAAPSTYGNGVGEHIEGQKVSDVRR